MESTENTPSSEAQDYLLLTRSSEEFDKYVSHATCCQELNSSISYRENYDECITTLQQLEKLKGRDAKSYHNQAVARFYKSKCKDYVNLLKTLQELEVNEVSLLISLIKCNTNSIKETSAAMFGFHVLPPSSLFPLLPYRSYVLVRQFVAPMIDSGLKYFGLCFLSGSAWIACC